MQNFKSLSRELITDEACIVFLQQKGIIQKYRICNNGHTMILQCTNNKKNRWRCHKCRHEVGVRTNNFLESSRIPFDDWILFIYSWANEMTSIMFGERELGMNKNTTVQWCNYLREVCLWKLTEDPMMIGGPNTTVEIDESLFSKRKNHAGRILPQQWVFGGICRETKECFMVCVPDRSAATLMPFIIRFIKPETTIISDQWRAYLGIKNAGFQHYTVNHSRNFVDPETLAHTQNVERLWKSAKERNKRQFGTNRAMMNSYIAEFLWRNSLKNKDAFETILLDIAEFYQKNK